MFKTLDLEAIKNKIYRFLKQYPSEQNQDVDPGSQVNGNGEISEVSNAH